MAMTKRQKAIQNAVEPGKAYASVSAQKWLKQDCPDILEYGFAEYPDFVVVAP